MLWTVADGDIQGVPIKNNSVEKKHCISVKVAWIWARLSEFVCIWYLVP